MARGRDAGELRVDLEKERVDLALLAIKLGGEIADMCGLYLVRLDRACCIAAFTVSRITAEKCLPSLFQFRAKSLCAPPRI